MQSTILVFVYDYFYFQKIVLFEHGSRIRENYGMVLQNNFAFMTFFVRPFATVIYENSSLSGRCNRRQVKPRNKNSESLVLTLRHQGFNQQYGKMFDDSIDHNSLSSFRSEWHDVAYSYTCFSRAMERETRSKLRIAEYQCAIDERFSFFLSRAIDRFYAIIFCIKDYFFACM